MFTFSAAPKEGFLLWVLYAENRIITRKGGGGRKEREEGGRKGGRKEGREEGAGEGRRGGREEGAGEGEGEGEGGFCCGFSMQRTERLQETRNTHIDELARESAAGFLCILVEIRQETQYSGSTLHVR